MLELFKWFIGLFPARSERREDFKAVTHEYEQLIKIIKDQAIYFEGKLTDCRKDHDEVSKRLVDADVKHAMEIGALKGQIKELSEEVTALRIWKHTLDPVQAEHITVLRDGIRRLEQKE